MAHSLGIQGDFPLAVGTSLGPLRDGATAAVIGGGPAGCSVALTLLRLARESRKQFKVRLFEPKHFGVHFNQCLGVLSPPILEILNDDFDLKLPDGMVQRRITGYELLTSKDRISLDEGEEETLAVRRVEFDKYLLEATGRAGAEIVRSRVTALELNPDGVNIFSEGEHTRADVVFGCFGLDPGMISALRRQSFYRPPRVIETLVTKYDCSDELLARFGNRIQAYLPRFAGIEFAAITPKARHASVVLAGRRITLAQLDVFLRLPEVAAFLPENFSVGEVFKGSFPGSPARHYFEDRFVAVGDAAGMIRPFKGKGINSAIITGTSAARTAVKHGISRQAFRRYERDCAFIIRDYPYGRFVRYMAKLLSKKLSLGPAIRLAGRNDEFRWALTKSVSGGATFRDIVFRCLRPGTALRMLGAYLSAPFHKRRGG